MRFWYRILLLCLLIGLILFARFSGVGSYLNVETIKEQREALQEFVAHNYIASVVIYMLTYSTIVILALPLAALLSITGGFLFGTFPAIIYVIVSATIGAIGSFFLVRHIIGNVIQRRFKDQLTRFNYYMDQYGTAYLLSVHFIAVIPFFVINMLAGLTNVSWWTFAWTTALGILPATVIYAFAGQQLNRIDTIRDIFSWQVILAFSLLALLSFAPIAISYVRKKRSTR